MFLKYVPVLKSISDALSTKFLENLTPNGTATQSTSYDSTDSGKPENAVNPPISNEYSLDNCSSTKFATSGIGKAWWMFEFSFGTAYITDITIYYRKDCKFTQINL